MTPAAPDEAEMTKTLGEDMRLKLNTHSSNVRWIATTPRDTWEALNAALARLREGRT